MNRQTPSRPCGVTVWASSVMTSPLTRWTGTPSATAASTTSPWRSLAALVANSSVSTPGRPSASRTACGPSARKDRERSRKARLASCRAAFTRGDLMLVTSAVVAGARRSSRSGRSRTW